MKTIFITDSPTIQQETIASVGFFDGVHRGHRFLIDRIRDRAQTAGLASAVITFPVHPRKVLQQNYQPRLLTTPEERAQLLAAAGLDYCYVIDFTPAFSETSAQDFIQKVLRQTLRVRELIIGYDHKFGKNRADGFEQYVAYGQACGMKVDRAEKLPEVDRHISSTAIRRLLAEGQARQAAEALAYPYALAGEVVHGNHMGRTIGFPTANLDLNNKEKLIPREGVYAVKVELENRPYRGMAYIGKRPTVAAAGEQRIEVHIFDFDRDIYGRQLGVSFLEFIRPDARFDSLAHLKEQLARDRQKALAAAPVR